MYQPDQDSHESAALNSFCLKLSPCIKTFSGVRRVMCPVTSASPSYSMDPVDSAAELLNVIVDPLRDPLRVTVSTSNRLRFRLFRSLNLRAKRTTNKTKRIR